MTGARVAAALLAVGAVAGVAAALLPEPALHPDPGTVCSAVAGLDGALDLTSVGDQVVVRARAAALADALARRAAGADAGEQDAGAARALLDLLEDPGATAAQLVEVVQPLADGCGVALQVASPAR